MLRVAPGYDAAIERRLAGFYDEVYGVAHTAFDVADWLGTFETVPCRA
jgi:formylmethanofuran dehydrogenase subunit A